MKKWYTKISSGIKIATFENIQTFHRTWLGRKWETGSNEIIQNKITFHCTVPICCATKIIVRSEKWQSKNSAVFPYTLNNLRTSHVIDIMSNKVNLSDGSLRFLSHWNQIKTFFLQCAMIRFTNYTLYHQLYIIFLCIICKMMKFWETYGAI